MTPPLHALLQLSLLADLWELFLVVFSHLALLGSASWVVFDALHFLLPRFHQLVVALAKLLFLKPQGKKHAQPDSTCADICGDWHGALMKAGLWGCTDKKRCFGWYGTGTKPLSKQDCTFSSVIKIFNSVSNEQSYEANWWKNTILYILIKSESPELICIFSSFFFILDIFCFCLLQGGAANRPSSVLWLRRAWAPAGGPDGAALYSPTAYEHGSSSWSTGWASSSSPGFWGQ